MMTHLNETQQKKETTNDVENCSNNKVSEK